MLCSLLLYLARRPGHWPTPWRCYQVINHYHSPFPASLPSSFVHLWALFPLPGGKGWGVSSEAAMETPCLHLHGWCSAPAENPDSLDQNQAGHLVYVFLNPFSWRNFCVSRLVKQQEWWLRLCRGRPSSSLGQLWAGEGEGLVGDQNLLGSVTHIPGTHPCALLSPSVLAGQFLSLQPICSTWGTAHPPFQDI